MYSNNYLYRRPSDASDSSSATLTDDKCYGINNSPYNYNGTYGSYNNYNNGMYNSSFYNANDEEYKNLPYASSYNSSNPLAINRNFSGNYNNYNYSSNYIGSSSFPTYQNSNYLDSYGNRRGTHRRSLSVGNTPSYGTYNYSGSDDGVYRSTDNDNYIYITRSSSTPSRRHLRYSSGGSYPSSYYRRNGHNNPIDYLDLSVNRDDYYGSRWDRRRRSLLRRNSKLGSDYYPFERKKSLLENLTSKFRKLRFGSDKYDDYYDDEDYRARYNELVRNNTLTNSMSMNNLDNQYNGYNSYNSNYNNNYNNYNSNYNNYNNNYNNYNNYNNGYNSNLNNNYNNYNSSQNDLYSFGNNRTCSDYTSQPPAQQLVKAPTMDNNTSSLNNYYNNTYSSSWNNNYSTNNLIDNQAFNLRNSTDDVYNNVYSSSYTPGLRRSSSTLFQGRHSRRNSYSGGNDYYTNQNDYRYNNNYKGSSSCLYNSYNNLDDNYYNGSNNNLYITNDNLATDDDDINYNKYKLRSHRRRRSSMKEYVDSNYYANNYDCNPKYYRPSRQNSKVTFDRNVQYWNPSEI